MQNSFFHSDHELSSDIKVLFVLHILFMLDMPLFLVKLFQENFFFRFYEAKLFFSFFKMVGNSWQSSKMLKKIY